jgi:hypothetical protein
MVLSVPDGNEEHQQFDCYMNLQPLEVGMVFACFYLHE